MNYSRIFSFWAGLGILFIVIFATPAIGVISMGVMGEFIGCDITKPVDCEVFGMDVSDRFVPYSMMFMTIFITPLSFWYAFYDVLIVWAIVLLGLYYKKRQEDKQMLNFE